MTGRQGEPDPVVAVVVDPVEQQVPALVAQRRVDQVGEASPDQRVGLLADGGGRGPVDREDGSVGSEGPHAHVEVVEQHYVRAALQLADGNRTSAAEILGLSRQSLYAKLDRYNLNKETDGEETTKGG